MKTIFTLFTSLLISATLMAAEVRPTSALTIRANDNSDIRVVVNGKRFEPRDNGVQIVGLEAGTHDVVIYKSRSNRTSSIATGRYDVVYDATVNLKRRTNLQILVDRNGRVSMMENRINNGRNTNVGRSYDYMDGAWGDYDSPNAYARGMANHEFLRVKESIGKIWLESSKMTSALHIVKSNALSSSQVKELVQMFSFETNKLELAKQAYANTVDKRNYHIVAESLGFQSNRVELERFTRGTQRF